MTEIPAIFKRVELLHGLSEDQLEHIATISERQVYHAGDVVFAKGDHATGVFIIDQGQIEVRMIKQNGEEAPAVFLGSGQMFGEMALLDQTTRSASIVVVEADTAIYKIANDAFLELCTTDTGIGFIMMRNIAQDLSFKLRHRDSAISS